MSKMSPTNHTVLTKEGRERKRDRLIARALKKANPYLYAQLEAEADLVMEFDDCNPFASVVGTSRQRPKMRLANAAKVGEMKMAIDAKFHPVMKPGVVKMMKVVKK